MFAGGGGIWGGLAPPPENLLDKERSPPSRPLPLEFPEYKPPSSSEPLSQQHMSHLRQIIARFRKPSDASDTLFSHFNIQLETDVPMSSQIPDRQFQQRPLLYDADLTAMLNELSFENEDSFREVLRMPPLEGRTKPRLAYSRNFFASLEDMSRYWDDTKDKYYKVATDADSKHTEGDHEMKDANGSPEAAAPVPSTEYAFAVNSCLKTGAAYHHSDEPPGGAATSDESTLPCTPLEKEVYKGYRLGNSAQTPPTTRISAVRNLTKMLTHKFNCRDFDNGMRERLKIKNIVIPAQMIMYTFNICRIPNDRNLAKARFVEGPVMSVYCRHEVVWKQETKDGLLAEGRDKRDVGDVIGEEFDFMREVGGLLILALQRARGEKGKKDEYWSRETQDWWWAHKPRWGGGETKWGQLASEQYDDEDPSWSPYERELQLAKRAEDEVEKKKVADVKSNDIQVEDLMADTAEERGDQPLKKRSRIGLPERMRRGGGGLERGKKGEEKIEYKDGRRLMSVPASKKKWYEEWKAVKPNSSPWDEKVLYQSTGKETGDFDDVYQIGCVNHHVCLTRMRVSKRYLQWIETGSVEDDHAKDGEDVVRIQRSPWFDLFDIEQRKEFLVGMWSVLCWLNRHEVPEVEFQRMEVLKQQAMDAAG